MSFPTSKRRTPRRVPPSSRDRPQILIADNTIPPSLVGSPDDSFCLMDSSLNNDSSIVMRARRREANGASTTCLDLSGSDGGVGHYNNSNNNNSFSSSRRSLVDRRVFSAHQATLPDRTPSSKSLGSMMTMLGKQNSLSSVREFPLDESTGIEKDTPRVLMYRRRRPRRAHSSD